MLVVVSDQSKPTLPPERKPLPDDRGPGITKRFRLPHTRHHTCPACGASWADDATLTMNVTVATYPDGSPGEVFFDDDSDLMGNTSRGLLQLLAISVSIGLQYGVPLVKYVEKFIGQSFGPSGFTGDLKYPIAMSVLDVIGRWLRDTYCK